MAEKYGYKESAEVLIAFNAITAFLILRFRDGVGIDDAAAIWDKLKNDEEFKAIIAAAQDKIGDVKNEIKDLSFPETVKLAALQISELPKLFDAIQGKAS